MKNGLKMKKTDIKLLITDIDGTVVDENCRYTPTIKSYFKKMSDMGIKVVLATGRMFDGADGVRRELELDTPVVCYQGAMVRQGDKILHECSVPVDIAREIIQISREKKFHLNLYNNDELIVEDDDKKMMFDYTNGRHTVYKVVNSFDEVELQNVSKLLAIIYKEEELLKLRDEMQEKFKGVLAVVRSHKYYLEFTNINATKGSSLEFLKKYWNIKTEEVMASGDQDNDFEMLQGAGIKIAMGNASEKLKQIADYICPTIKEDGLSRAIERYIL